MEVWSEIAVTLTEEDKANINNVMSYPHSVCRNCESRKSKIPQRIPADCLECGWLRDRDEPDYVGIPVFEDGYVPSYARARKEVRHV